MSNVTPLKVVPPDPSCGLEPQENVIRCLEQLLEAAKTGAVQSVAIGWVKGDGRPSFGWTTGDRAGDNYVLMAGISALQHDMCFSLCDNAEESESPYPDEAG